jgi:hypothetical protein
VQLRGKQEKPPTQYHEARLNWSTREQLAVPLVNRVPVTVSSTGAAEATLSVMLECVRTSEAEAEWRQSVFDALLSAWSSWRREFQAEQDRMGSGGVLAERSPARHREMVLQELKRLVISWMTQEEPFMGRDGIWRPGLGTSNVPLPGSKPEGIDPDRTRTLTVAADVQFLEQAFEWLNLMYVPYGYYWGRRQDWEALAPLETIDPELGRFLRAGSVRVVVPIRKGFEDAMQHWLQFGVPWEGGPAPVPGDPEYLAIAHEIRDLTQPPADGTPDDVWEARLPTSLRWLDTSQELPKNAQAVLGPLPVGVNPLCPG